MQREFPRSLGTKRQPLVAACLASERCGNGQGVSQFENPWGALETGAVVRVGRALDNDVVVPDKRASRYHLELHRDGDGWRVQDLGSGNGTELNGQPVQTAHARVGDVLSIGSTRLRVSVAGVEFEDGASATPNSLTTLASTAGASAPPQYKPGDIVNGHRLSHDGTRWEPLPSPPQPSNALRVRSSTAGGSWLARHKVLTATGAVAGLGIIGVGLIAALASADASYKRTDEAATEASGARSDVQERIDAAAERDRKRQQSDSTTESEPNKNDGTIAPYAPGVDQWPDGTRVDFKAGAEQQFGQWHMDQAMANWYPNQSTICETVTVDGPLTLIDDIVSFYERTGQAFGSDAYSIGFATSILAVDHCPNAYAFVADEPRLEAREEYEAAAKAAAEERAAEDSARRAEEEARLEAKRVEEESFWKWYDLYWENRSTEITTSGARCNAFNPDRVWREVDRFADAAESREGRKDPYGLDGARLYDRAEAMLRETC